MTAIELQPRTTNGGKVTGSIEEGFDFSLPVLPAGKYGLAQVDNYMHLGRVKFPYRPLIKLELEVRVSDGALPGTWGFGFWNDPFSIGFGGGGMRRVLPALPNAAWFFYGSGENYLSLDDTGSGAGFRAQIFHSPQLPSLLSLLAAPGLPLLMWPAAARLLRRLLRVLVKEASTALPLPVKNWQTYELTWLHEQVCFKVDGREVLTTKITPRGQLGLVIWVDNQYFRFDSAGKVGFGFLPVSADQWMQVRHLSVTAFSAF